MKAIHRLLFICVVALLVAACTTPSAPVTSEEEAQPAVEEAAETEEPAPAEPEHHRIGVLLLNSQVKRYFAIDVPNMEAVAEDAGYELLVQSAEYDAKLQVSQAESILTQGVDVILLQPANVEAAAAIVEMAYAEGVPVVGYNDLPEDVEIEAFVGRDPYEAGVVTAEAALEHHPTGNYVLIGGDASNSVAQEFVRGWHDVLDPEVEAGNVNIVSDQFQTNWDAKLAVDQTENALTQNNDDIQVVLGNNDDLARGAGEAVKAAGLPLGTGPNEVYINGMDTLDGMLQAIAEGTMGGSIWGSFDEMGREAATTAIAVAEGEDFEYDTTINNGWGEIPWVQSDVYLITKDNIDEFVCETGDFWVPVETVYENVPRDEWPDCE